MHKRNHLCYLTGDTDGNILYLRRGLMLRRKGKPYSNSVLNMDTILCGSNNKLTQIFKQRCLLLIYEIADKE